MTSNFLSKLRAYLRKVVCPLGEIIRHIPLQSSVFDLGCGTGAILVELIKNRQVNRAGGSETSPSLLAMARDAARQAIGDSIGPGDFHRFQVPADLSRFLRLYHADRCPSPHTSH
jgi:trans-aconitate methyltransferase